MNWQRGKTHNGNIGNVATCDPFVAEVEKTQSGLVGYVCRWDRSEYYVRPNLSVVATIKGNNDEDSLKYDLESYIEQTLWLKTKRTRQR